jgi:hypothetical protein
MTHGSEGHQFQMFVDGLFHETGPSYEMAVFERLQKGRILGLNMAFYK